ncbi:MULTISPECIES: spore germination protein [Geobacillus]|uniref:Spore germination protein n=1 Tax=Geobacillus thermocatenulatus TaxID=33938 RepID=A0A226QCD8_9BACL|nr:MULTISPECIES: spore germination protein [Geobacillus]ASS98299.1 spore germination protein [Geobacillus thermocatenulatus]KLR74271.1 spore gernimation protein GerA [Geobacillus sp. T6]OXB89059.1 spore germination protein [Geobacillus thermocatenulatus]RAN22359.1 spore gernimation protein GerA [Geobacillus sp. A8]
MAAPSESVWSMLQTLGCSLDFQTKVYRNQTSGQRIWVSYIEPMIDIEIAVKNIFPYLLHYHFSTLQDLCGALPLDEAYLSSDPNDMKQKLLEGYLLIRLNETDETGLLVKAQKTLERTLTIPEVEFSVVGPKESFIESLETNLYLLRKRIPSDHLTVNMFRVGTLSKTKLAVVYIDGIADPENVQTVSQRIQAVEFDEVIDSSYIVQLISDNRHSLFPQLLDTERPDRVAAVLAEGKVAILVDGSPHALIGPTTLVEFFSSFEDYFLNWIIASFFRLIRLFSVAFSILITPIYVATLNYHYELIPKDLLGTLITSRKEIPFPPIVEVLFLELTIELLREAGARLPTKVGQTIGIVGGIVIGTASVEAGLTSNVLLILVALAALASFTTPVYKMGNTIRLMRFPFLLFAEMWGLLGVAFCFCIVMTHLLSLTSLGRPFLAPLYPPRWKDWKDALIRLPFTSQAKRPSSLRTPQPIRFDGKKAKEKRDIDE